MNPKKSKSVIDKTAKTFQYPEELVADLYSFFWEDVRKKLSRIEYNDVYIENFGTFQIKPIALEKTIEKYQNHINKFDRTSFKTFPLYEKMQARLNVLKEAKQRLYQEKEAKKQFKLAKYGKDISGNMEG